MPGAMTTFRAHIAVHSAGSSCLVNMLVSRKKTASSRESTEAASTNSSTEQSNFGVGPLKASRPIAERLGGGTGNGDGNSRSAIGLASLRKRLVTVMFNLFGIAVQCHFKLRLDHPL